MFCMYCVSMICPVLQSTTVRFSVCAAQFLLIKQATPLAIKDRNVDALSQSYSELFLHLDYGYSGRFSDTKTQMDYIATESHRSLATRLFRFDTRSPRAKFFASLAYSFNRPPLNMLCSCY